MARRNLLNFFDDLSLARGTFLSYDDGYRNRSYTYEEVTRAARAFAGRLGDFGISSGDKVLVWGENRPEWVVAFWGCLLAGAIVVPIDYRASAEFVARVWKIVDGRLVLLGDDVSEDGTSRDSLPDASQRWKLASIDWHASGSNPLPTVRDTISLDSTAEIIFTSGATAEPKGVIITHRNVLANIEPVEREVLKYRKYGRPFYPLRFLNLLP
ncbi:MAG TPA: class I adenylate-forming enzyme family protein, partial [Vicinamibacterales bacterium]